MLKTLFSLFPPSTAEGRQATSNNNPANAAARTATQTYFVS